MNGRRLLYRVQAPGFLITDNYKRGKRLIQYIVHLMSVCRPGILFFFLHLIFALPFFNEQ